MTVSDMDLRDHAVGIHVSRPAPTSIFQSNGRVIVHVHLRIHCFMVIWHWFMVIWHCFMVIWTLFGTVWYTVHAWDPDMALSTQ